MTSTNSNLLKNLSLKIKDGNNETDTLSILILIHLLEICCINPTTTDGFFRYDYCNLRETFDISHNVLKNRLNRLQNFKLISYKVENIKGDKKGLFIYINIEEINKYMGATQSDIDTYECPCGNIDMPVRDSQPTHTEIINNYYKTKNNNDNDDDNKPENHSSDSDSLESLNHFIQQICRNVNQAETVCNCKFGSVTGLFNFRVPLMISSQGRILIGGSEYDADIFLSKIAELTPDKIIKVFSRINNKPTLSSWESYLLKALYRETLSQSSKAPIIPLRTVNPTVEKKCAGYTQQQYDFAALQKTIDEN